MLANPRRYLTALCSLLPVSEQSIDIVCRLLLHGRSQTDPQLISSRLLSIAGHVAPSFVCRCMASCTAAGDRHAQNRLVRAVCDFIRSLVSARALSLSDLSVEVQAFCVEFSRVREAASLFRELKAGPT